MAAIIASIILIALAKLVIDGLLLLFARDYVRNWPELRREWLGSGSWVAFSRRYGLPYAVALVVGAFVWVLAGVGFVPNTDAGVWLLFGPSITMLVAGAVLGALCVARWVGNA